MRAARVSLAGLAALTAVCVMSRVGRALGLPLNRATDHGLFSSGQSTATQLGNLFRPLSAFQLAGIWPVGDFR